MQARPARGPGGTTALCWPARLVPLGLAGVVVLALALAGSGDSGSSSDDGPNPAENQLVAGLLVTELRARLGW